MKKTAKILILLLTVALLSVTLVFLLPVSAEETSMPTMIIGNTFDADPTKNDDVIIRMASNTSFGYYNADKSNNGDSKLFVKKTENGNSYYEFTAPNGTTAYNSSGAATKPWLSGGYAGKPCCAVQDASQFVVDENVKYVTLDMDWATMSQYLRSTNATTNETGYGFFLNFLSAKEQRNVSPLVNLRIADDGTAKVYPTSGSTALATLSSAGTWDHFTLVYKFVCTKDGDNYDYTGSTAYLYLNGQYLTKKDNFITSGTALIDSFGRIRFTSFKTNTTTNDGSIAFDNFFVYYYHTGDAGVEYLNTLTSDTGRTISFSEYGYFGESSGINLQRNTKAQLFSVTDTTEGKTVDTFDSVTELKNWLNSTNLLSSHKYEITLLSDADLTEDKGTKRSSNALTRFFDSSKVVNLTFNLNGYEMKQTKANVLVLRSNGQNVAFIGPGKITAGSTSILWPNAGTNTVTFRNLILQAEVLVQSNKNNGATITVDNCVLINTKARNDGMIGHGGETINVSNSIFYQTYSGGSPYVVINGTNSAGNPAIFTNCAFYNKSSGYLFANYSAEGADAYPRDVRFINCDFKGSMAGNNTTKGGMTIDETCTLSNNNISKQFVSYDNALSPWEDGETIVNLADMITDSAAKAYFTENCAEVMDISYTAGYKLAPTVDITWKGGSIRKSPKDAERADLRFGYDFALAEDAELVSVQFDYSLTGSDFRRTAPTETVIRATESASGNTVLDNEDGTYTANLVITDIGEANYKTDIYVRLVVNYTVDGEARTTVYETVNHKNLYEVATAIVAAGREPENIMALAQAIVDAD